MSEALRRPEPDDLSRPSMDAAAQSEAEALIAAVTAAAEAPTGDGMVSRSTPARADRAAGRAHGMAELEARAVERAEAEAAVGAVMTRVAEKAAKAEAQAVRGLSRPKPLKLILLASLAVLNLILWLTDPQWLHFKEPQAPAMQYYQDSWKMAAYLQAQRIEEYRKEKQQLPAKADDVHFPVHGVDYLRVTQDQYQLAAGVGNGRVVYDSRIPLSEWLGRSIIRLGMLTNGAGR